MDEPRPEKVAVVDEVRGRLDAAAAAVLTEYRGLTVSDMAALRRALRGAGGDYKVYKNTLVKLAIAGGRHQVLDQLLSGPTGITFVSGEVTAVAKALRDYARANPSLVVKGGLMGDGFLSAQDLARMADLPSREELLARFAGALAAPMRQLAGLLQALPRNLAYGLSALIEQRGGPVATPGGGAAGDAADEGETVDSTTADSTVDDTAADTAEQAVDDTAADTAEQAVDDTAADNADQAVDDTAADNADQADTVDNKENSEDA
ncbi:MAG TPA: 50S ribosomal protein L10 [Acidimicrobiales bacterium]|nr:50S ribosomal protein L10 [Acidimicrobiales bacterium]